MAAEALEQSVLESKDKDQLLAIAKALGLKASTRTKKSDIIDQILETTGGVAGNGDAPPSSPTPCRRQRHGDDQRSPSTSEDAAVATRRAGAVDVPPPSRAPSREATAAER